MRIGFDGKRAVQNYTGLGNYSRFVADILSRYYPHNQYILYAPRPGANQDLSLLLERPQLSVAYPPNHFWQRLKSLWRVWGIVRQLKKEKIDLFHGLSNELPLPISKGGVKSIVTIHDLIFLRYPEYYHRIDRWIYTYKFRKACEHSNRIIAVSQTTKQDIVHFFGIDEAKISVIYQGCNPLFKQPVPVALQEEVRQKYRLPARYILNVGSIESRKNLLLIVKALPYLAEEVEVVAIGRRTPYTATVEEYARTHGLQGRLHIFHSVPLHELPAFYRQAAVFVYPSFFEGFGIPIIEAIHCGVPVIAATGSCLEEAGGPDSLYVHPEDEKALANAIDNILSSPGLARKMIDNGRQYVQRFSDETIAQQLVEIYQEVLRSSD
ncbi:MAG: glycosyltransferase family 4 protein [Mediterranea sp.]|jgi:glycosyltransferase involved in cell wall biosynthesis|nr:glycosyltransferase family 4 protein [Mediterranea sp.]